MLTRENQWRAERHGLQATVVDLSAGGPVPIARTVETTLRDIAEITRLPGGDRHG